MRIPLELFLLGFRKNAAAFGSQKWYVNRMLYKI
jgi:hypothetical protein